MTDPRYPIGKFTYDSPPSPEERRDLLTNIEKAPAKLRAAVSGLSNKQLDTPYREGGWTVRQVAHHVPDSHMNGFIRFKLALTEDEPTIKPYMENLWADLSDAKAPPEVSLVLLECIHGRWMMILRSMRDNDWKRTFRHPEMGLMTLDMALALYSWHGRHHIAHVTTLREKMDW